VTDDPWPHIPVPTTADLRGREWLTGSHLEVCLLLLEHGINPDDIPAGVDSLTNAGYLCVTGRVIGNEIETRRVAWPDGLWAQITRIARNGA
jgi:hypothetical protein